MSEYEHDLPASDDLEWTALVLDVENRFQAVNDALDDLRGVVARLSSYQAQAHVIAEPQAQPVPVVEPVAELEMPEAPQEEAAEVEVWTPPEAEEEPSPLADDEAARREAVSRIVEEAKQELTGGHNRVADGSWAVPSDLSGLDSTSEGSWPMVRPRPTPALHPSARPSFGDESGGGKETETGDEAARRDEVARMVAEMRAGLGGTAEVSEEQDAPDAAPGAGWSEEQTETADRPVMDEETSGGGSRQDEISRMVAEMRSEMAEGEPGGGDSGDAVEDDKEVRDEVRRAVEAAKAEMASGWGRGEEPAAETAEKKRFSFPNWETTHMEPSGPPVIVIKDPEGRVELARVYEALSRVNCDENAALLNYTPHSVTVGLNVRASVPTKEAMAEAVEKVFGRKCRVESDGVRVSVDIGGGQEEAA